MHWMPYCPNGGYWLERAQNGGWVVKAIGAREHDMSQLNAALGSDGEMLAWLATRLRMEAQAAEEKR
jgi:hypothetical protein